MSIIEVAKIAGVSSSTVSRVINNHPRVAPETAKAVRDAMRELAYTPSDRRPGPKPSFRTRTGVLNVRFLALGTVRSTATPGFSELLSGVSQASSYLDLHLSFSHVPDPIELPRRLFEERVDGLLLHGAVPAAPVREQLAHVPTVWLMGNRTRPDWGDQVMPDAYEIGEQAAAYLLGRGHQTLAFLNLDAQFWPFRMYEHAFTITARGRGAAVSRFAQERPVVSSSYWQAPQPEAVERLVEDVLNLDPQPTGLFVADSMQVAMIQPALQRRGVKVGPGGVELIACNNEEPYLVGLHPRPAVIDIRVGSIGRRGVEQLAWRLQNRDRPERITVAIEPMVIEPQAGFRQ